LQLNYFQEKPLKYKPLPNKSSNDPFHLHKIGLRPLLRTLTGEETGTLIKTLGSIDLEEFFVFLHRQGLAQLWLQFLLEQGSLPAAFEEPVNNLKKNAINTTAAQLMQRKILQDTRGAFETAGIEFLIFKGVQLRHTLYTDPIHRSVCDIDILVRDEQKFDAIKALLQAGFIAHHKAENISHETSLVKNGVCIDLHWHLMRPGRSHIDLSNYLFSQRQEFSVFEDSGFYGVSNEANLLVMLVHPAITKYVNGSAASLRHLVDIHRLAQSGDINWDRLGDTFEESGTCTAAWASLTWLQMLADQPLFEDLLSQLRPGNLQAAWLSNWLGRDFNTRFAKRRLVIRICFSLLLQDSLKDSFRAVSVLRQEKLKAEEIMRKLEQLEESHASSRGRE
jgi:hypothetical protein